MTSPLTAATNWRAHIVVVVLSILASAVAAAAENTSPPSNSENGGAPARILLRRHMPGSRNDREFLDSLARDTGVRWRHDRSALGNVEVLQTDAVITAETLKKLRARADVAYAVVDQRKHRHAVPNDSLYSSQWYLQNTEAAAIAANVAWDTTTGSTGTVIAVLDTGVRFDHPDLARADQAGKLLPGFDFVGADGGGAGSQFLTANDGDGWDADPSDPGDWIDSTDKAKSFFSQCQIENSSWHGTRVAGIIGAASNNAIGIAGTTWQSYILPVRVLGKCGGYDSDILAAMRWAAGLSVSGVPTNPNPAKIINLSLGSPGACTQPYIDVINELTQAGVIVVASAGNEGGPVDSPANCPGVIAVAGLRQIGTKVGYSSLGPEVTIAAPAGNCVNTSGACLFSLDTTYDIGTKTPSASDYTNQVNTNLGTSFSAPLGAGVLALMHSVNARLGVAQLRSRLMEGARAFPTTSTTSPAPPICHEPTGAGDVQASECICTTTTCGAGMLYAPGALVAAQRPIASITTPVTVNAGASISIDGSSSVAACNRTIQSYSWSVVATQGTSTPVLANADQPVVQVNAPASGNFTLRLTVTDDHGATDTGDAIVTSTSATANTTPPLSVAACPQPITIEVPPPPPPPPPTATPAQLSKGGSGGGGQFGVGLLLALFSLSLYRLRPNSTCRSS